MNCPHCGKPLPDHAAFCSKCGKSVIISKPSAVPAQEAPTANCPHCGSPLPEHAAFCTSCGKSISSAAPHSEKKKKGPKGKRSKLSLLIAVCVLVFAAAGVGAWMVLGTNAGSGLSGILHHSDPKPLGSCTSVICSYDIETDTINQKFYDENGSLLYTLTIDRSSTSTLYAYDMYQNITNTIEYSDMLTIQSMEYSSDRQIQSQTTEYLYSTSQPEIVNSTYQYDDSGALLCVRNVPSDDPSESSATTYAYDASGHVLQELTVGIPDVEDAYHMTRYIYNNAGLVAQKTTVDSDDGNSYQSEFYTYDEKQQIIHRVTFDDNSYICEDSEYNDDGQLVRRATIDADYIDSVSVYDYNSDGTLSTITTSYPGGDKGITSLSYADGSLTSLVIDDALFGNTTYEFSSSPELCTVRMTERDSPDILSSSWTFSDSGATLSSDFLTAEFDSDWNLIRAAIAEFDMDRNLIRAAEDNNTCSYEYDDANRLIRSVDSSGETTQERQYNAQGLLSSIADSYVRYFTYDENGNLIQVADADSAESFTLSYDACGNLVSIIVPEEGSLAASYDGYRMTGFTATEDGDHAQISYSYSEGGLLAGAVISVSEDLFIQTDYNSAGCVSHYKYSSEDDEAEYFCSFDSVSGMPFAFSGPNGGVVWEFDQAGRLISRRKSDNAWKHTWTYDDAGRLVSYSSTFGTDFTETTYSYDENGLFAG